MITSVNAAPSWAPPRRRAVNQMTLELKFSVQVASDPEPVGGIAHVHVVVQPGGAGPGVGIVPPGPAAQDPLAAIALQPRGTIRGSALVIVVPAVCDPFGDTAVHVVE